MNFPLTLASFRLLDFNPSTRINLRRGRADTFLHHSPWNDDDVSEFGVPCLDGLHQRQVGEEKVCVDNEECGGIIRRNYGGCPYGIMSPLIRIHRASTCQRPSL